MPHSDYLKIQTEDPRAARFAAKMADFERDIVSTEVMSKPAAQLNDDECRLLDRHWAAPLGVPARRCALDARFPLVIYHSGAASSFEDLDLPWSMNAWEMAGLATRSPSTAFLAPSTRLFSRFSSARVMAATAPA